MNHQINRLLNFALQKGMIGTEDLYYAANLILDLLQLDEFELEEIDEKLETAQDIIDHILDYAVPFHVRLRCPRNYTLFEEYRTGSRKNFRRKKTGDRTP